LNRIGGVMVSVLAASVVDRGFELSVLVQYKADFIIISLKINLFIAMM
jgi:hypothetical protein